MVVCWFFVIGLRPCRRSLREFDNTETLIAAAKVVNTFLKIKESCSRVKTRATILTVTRVN